MKKQYRILQRKYNWINSQYPEKDTAKFLIKKAENKLYDEWAIKVRRHFPDLAKRVFNLREKYLVQCGRYNYLEALLGTIISDLSKVDYSYKTDIDKTAFRMITEIFVNDLFIKLQKEEKKWL
jgi:hypothetical protein